MKQRISVKNIQSASETSSRQSESVHIQLLTADSLEWLKQKRDQSITNILSGIPDMEEIGETDISSYTRWVERVVKLLFQKTQPKGYVILIQTDRKIAGQWLDKSTVINNVASRSRWRLLWHKIVLNRPVGSANLHRPTYSHMLCYSQLSKPGNAIPDVIYAGDRWYKNGTPVEAVKLAISFLLEKENQWSNEGSDSFDIVDPFVGQGTILYYAREAGLSALGIDIDPDQILETRRNLLEKS